MEEQKQNQLPAQNSAAGANIAVGVMCLVLALGGLDNLASKPAGLTFRTVLDILMFVAGLIGFVVNLVVFLHLRKK